MDISFVTLPEGAIDATALRAFLRTNDLKMKSKTRVNRFSLYIGTLIARQFSVSLN